MSNPFIVTDVPEPRYAPSILQERARILPPQYLRLFGEAALSGLPPLPQPGVDEVLQGAAQEAVARLLEPVTIRLPPSAQDPEHILRVPDRFLAADSIFLVKPEPFEWSVWERWRKAPWDMSQYWITLRVKSTLPSWMVDAISDAGARTGYIGTCRLCEGARPVAFQDDWMCPTCRVRETYMSPEGDLADEVYMKVKPIWLTSPWWERVAFQKAILSGGRA